MSGLLIVKRKFSDKRVKRSIFDILKRNVLCSMATVDKNGRAHINTAYFAYSNCPELFFCSYPDSIHCKNLSKNSSMAITVFESAQTWGKPDRGIQLLGSCHESKGNLRKKAEKVYGSRFKGFAK
ncbi:MAG: pyridoxamine 5'-phosphate oxidase family protein [archaeon]|nr:pyridoxamine 5'-phosphate oxidase family protein [archaeon]